MAKNITQFFTPTAPNNTVAAADLIHLGRTANPDPADQDIALTGTEFFGSMNAQAAVLGSPGVVGDVMVGGVPERLRNYGTQIGLIGTPDEVAGTITVQTSGVYRITVNLIAAAPSNFNFDIACVMRWQSGTVLISGQAVSNRANAGNVINLAGGTLIPVTAGDVMELEVESTAAINPITFPNGTFEVTPIFLV
jgi:hypothetical protein